MTAVVSLATDLKSYKVFNSKGEELEMTPRWYSNYIWKGERPSNQSRSGVFFVSQLKRV